MKVSIVGTGRMGRALLQTLSPHIGDLKLGSRSPEGAEQIIRETGSRAEAVSHREALKADLLIPALWYRDLREWLDLHREELNGKTVVDITNPFNDTFDDFTIDRNTSAAEELQRLVPGTKIVGAFKNTFWKVFEQPVTEEGKSDVFVTGDDEETKKTVIRLFRPLPFRFLDAGPLSNNRTIERMTLLARELSVRYGHYPYVSYRLWGNKLT